MQMKAERIKQNQRNAQFAQKIRETKNASKTAKQYLSAATARHNVKVSPPVHSKSSRLNSPYGSPGSISWLTQ